MNKILIVCLVVCSLFAITGYIFLNNSNNVEAKSATSTLQSKVNTDENFTLSIPSMFCATCPITVRKALEKVDGISNIEIKLEARTAQIFYAEHIESKTELIKQAISATTNAGYPAFIVEVK
ncbi:MAG: cation transporter [Saccharospirillaceae bacterium]|nr:cation transporter [Pseudomonadales bacterium]NRB78983.1 cation transporter [Saccharospirillaceae bacterium]